MPTLAHNDWSGDITECPLSRYHTAYKSTVDAETRQAADEQGSSTSSGSESDREDRNKEKNRRRRREQKRRQRQRRKDSVSQSSVYIASVASMLTV